jgi:hypothetical protein
VEKLGMTFILLENWMGKNFVIEIVKRLIAKRITKTKNLVLPNIMRTLLVQTPIRKKKKFVKNVIKNFRLRKKDSEKIYVLVAKN